jgi:ribosome-associated protein
VREAGFDKPRVEGEENGEWIVVDCGAVVVHVMQPSIRQYYRLEEIWGSKPVRLKFGAPAPAARPAAMADSKASKAPKAKPAKPKATDKSKAKPSASDAPAAKPAKAAKPRKPAQPKA